jgi:hypothetical protein
VVKQLKHHLGLLEEKLTWKIEVVAELLEENVKLKKDWGDTAGVIGPR